MTKPDPTLLQSRISELEVEISELRASLNAIQGQLGRQHSRNKDEDAVRSEQAPFDNETLRELALGNWSRDPLFPPRFGWDTLVDPWVDIIPTIGEKIPSAYRIWQSSRRYLLKGDLQRAERCERLNYLFHNSYIPAQLELEGEVTFAYGGIGVILHKDAHICKHVTIGANTTIGGNGHQVRIDERSGKKTTVPKLGEFTTVGACANITGGIELGPLSIVAPNAVVTKSFPAGAIIGGVPARQIGQITLGNVQQYKAKSLPARQLSDSEFLEIAERALKKVEN